MALPALVDSALAIAKATTPSATVGAAAATPEDSTPGSEAALMALEALAACTPQEREANR